MAIKFIALPCERDILEPTNNKEIIDLFAETTENRQCLLLNN